MKIIFGLGNPGDRYTLTRHNIGFALLDYLFNDLCYKEKFGGLYAEVTTFSEKLLIVKPVTYINLSGEVVRKYVNYFKVNLDDILIIQDDLDMSIGNIKLTYNHSHGGHNGIRNIEENLNTKMYLRLKLGISNNEHIDAKDYVLGTMTKEEIKVINFAFKKLDNLAYDFVCLDRNQLMNKYNSC